jgi:hypothetical protein
MKGDQLASLQTDKSQLTYQEKMMMDALYPSSSIQTIEQTIEHFPQESKKIWVSFREIIISTILFLILNMPQVDTLIGKFSKSENIYYRLGMKTILFALSFFILTNLSLSRSS